MTRINLLLAAFILSSCGGDNIPPPPLADKQAALAPAPKADERSLLFAVQSQGAQMKFAMQAPLEKQDGEVPASAVSGELDVDLTDLTKSTGLVDVDISDLVIYQRKAETEGVYAEREKSDLQNEHVRDWLEIGEDAPGEEAKKNKLAQFALKRVESPSQTNIRAMSGADRVVTFTGIGEFRLHQRVATKQVKLEAKFHFDGDEPSAVEVRTVEPLRINLAEHDVRPRTAFGKLAAKSLEAMAPKVAQEAEVSLSFTAKPKSQR